MEPTAPQVGTKRALPAAAAGGGGGDDDSDRSDLADRKVRFPKGKTAKYRDPSAAGGSGESGAATEDTDSLMNPELAAVKRARRRHRREGDDAQGTANVKGFEMRYKQGESRQGDREAAIDAEMSRVNKLPANSSYAIHRMKVLNKLRHLISIKRTTSQDEELELLFASLLI